MDPFSRGDREEPASSASSNPPDREPGNTPGAGSQEWQTPASDRAPSERGPSEPAQDDDAPGADESAQNYAAPGRNPYAQSPYGQSQGAPGAGSYGQQYRSPGEGGYGQSGYGNSGYGNSGYGNSGYDYPGYGYPGYGYPGYGNAPSQPPARRRGRTALLAIAIVAGLIVLVVGFGGGVGAALILGHGVGLPQANVPPGNGNGNGNGSNGNGGNGNGGNGNTGSLDLSHLASQLDPAIVDINGIQTNGAGQTVAEDAGTGVIITSDGEVLTNNHVIEGNSSMTATLASGQKVPIKVLGEDPSADVALVQLEGVHNLPTINIHNGANASVGEAVAAFGNAGGQGGTPAASQGSITATDKTITASLGGGPQDSETLSGMIEESAQICEGDSGGVLANAQGKYLGMITAASSGGNQGNQPGEGGNGGNQQGTSCSNDGYVIPASKIIPIVHQIESGQRSASVIIGVPGFLGVEVDDSQSSTDGAQVVGLVQDGGAAQAGLPQTFVITAIDGQPVTSSSSLSTVLQQYTPGTTVQVTWNDGQGGPSQTTNVTLGSGPPA